jgi:hypothetical protein
MLRKAIVYLPCILVVSLTAVGDEIVISLPIERYSRSDSPTPNDTDRFSLNNAQIGLSVMSTEYENPVDLDSAGSLEPLLLAMKNMMLAAIANDSESYRQGLLQEEDLEYSIHRMRRKLLPEFSTTELPQVTSVTTLAGISIVRAGPGSLATENLVAVNGEYKLLEISEEPPIRAYDYFLALKKLEPLRAVPFEPNQEFNRVLIDKHYAFDPGTYLNKLYFKGFIPTWGRKILSDGNFLTDKEELLHKEEAHYELIRFIRECWHLYSKIPDDADIRNSPAFKGYATRLTIDLQNTFVQGAAKASPFGRSEIARYFGVKHFGIRLLYVIDADPFYLAIWLPGERESDDELYKKNGFAGVKPAGFTNSYGVDLYQRDGQSYFVIGLDCIPGTMILNFFKWKPVQDAMLSFIADAYEEEFNQD